MHGRSIPLTTARTFVADLSHAAWKVPQGVIMRSINVSAVMAARKRMDKKPPLTAYFVKAWAEVARELPELRRTYVTLPWPRLYEHGTSIASLMIEREMQGEKVLFPARIKSPAERDLVEVAADIEAAVTQPIMAISRNRMSLRVSRLPLLVRRLIWWLAFNLPRQRQHYVGTFGVSVLGHLGTSILYPVSPTTTFLSYGPIAPDGMVDIMVGFDHRVMDGAVVAIAIGLLEEKLKGLAA